ncbi:hypothetical protein F0562_034254 [Nyssa sinensis]|uniref:GDSL esterase/lipase n=1 Tax=Nyssa sinensis TaxID=561372 RepID=A0A5J5AIX0_9ASTE|nr:hypothetical protein F0562_034254 [Nyssa sinensis]
MERRLKEESTVQPGGCQFPAIFNFGDSNSDTGNVAATFYQVPRPYGETFFGKPSGRNSDGRLIIDFIALKLGFPYLRAHLDGIGANFRHGANFAAGGSTVRPASGSLCIRSRLPRPEDFSRALYIIDSGQNDLHASLATMTRDKVRAFSSRYSRSVCCDHTENLLPGSRGGADKNGCVKSFNEMAQEFNKQLKDRVFKLRTQLQDAVITYVDIYSAKYSLISQAEKHGFANPLDYCCGSEVHYSTTCGRIETVNGSEVYGASCIPNRAVFAATPCEFPAIFNFGDSNSDTGGLSAAFGQAGPPNGESYFHGPAGRYSDGRLVIDFIAESLGLPYLSAFLDAVGSNFTHGANFATAGSTIRPQNTTLHQSGFSPISLNVQFYEFNDFHRRSQIVRNKGGVFRELLPKAEDFSHALYTFDIGQNDLTAGYFLNMSTDQVRAYIPDVLDQFNTIIKDIYDQGGRSFWIHNTGPVGCLPYVMDRLLITAGQVDMVGCASPFNEVAQYFNHRLKEAVVQLRKDLPLAAITYVDVYSVKYSLISQANKHGPRSYPPTIANNLAASQKNFCHLS